MQLEKYWGNHPIIRYLPLAVIGLFPLLFIFKNDSYWFDEVFSLGMVKDSIPVIINEWLPYDVHPPLYNLILWVWVRLTGFSEQATRLLSWLFYLGAVLSYTFYLRNLKLIPFIFGALFLFSYQIAFYALEVRGYSMIFFLSTLYVVRYYKIGKLDTKGCFILCLLSLGHLFSLLLSAVILAVSYFKKYGLTFKHHFKIFWMFIWPVLPSFIYLFWVIYYGAMLTMTGGKFWIKTDFNEALDIIIKVFVPFSASLKGWTIYPLAIGFFTTLACLAWLKKLSFVGEMLLSFFLGILILLLVNFHSPLIMGRYLLVFLPIVFIPLAISLQQINYTRNLGKFFGVIFLFGFAISIKQINFNLGNRTKMLDNLKGQAAFIALAKEPVYFLLDSVKQHYYSEHAWQSMASFYLWKDWGWQQSMPLISLDQVNKNKKPYLLAILHEFDFDTKEALKQKGLSNFEVIQFKSSGGMSYCIRILE